MNNFNQVCHRKLETTEVFTSSGAPWEKLNTKRYGLSVPEVPELAEALAKWGKLLLQKVCTL